MKEKSICLLMDALEKFYGWLGLRHNNSKSNVDFFGIFDDERRYYRQLFGIKEVFLPSNFLGSLYRH